VGKVRWDWQGALGLALRMFLDHVSTRVPQDLMEPGTCSIRQMKGPCEHREFRGWVQGRNVRLFWGYRESRAQGLGGLRSQKARKSLEES
jgi:hypothetical protein